MSAFARWLVVAATAGSLACASSPEPTEVVARTTVEGRGYPSGTSDSENSMVLTRVATSRTYGYSESEPILLGGTGPETGPQRSRRYLNSLRGPKGEIVSYERIGSCCYFETKNSELGSGMLDKYALRYQGLSDTLVLYINMYDPGEPLIPQGLTSVQ